MRKHKQELLCDFCQKSIPINEPIWLLVNERHNENKYTTWGGTNINRYNFPYPGRHICSYECMRDLANENIEAGRLFKERQPRPFVDNSGGKMDLY